LNNAEGVGSVIPPDVPARNVVGETDPRKKRTADPAAGDATSRSHAGLGSFHVRWFDRTGPGYSAPRQEM